MNKLRVEPFTTTTAQCPSLVDEETGKTVAKITHGESYEDADLFAHELCRRINSAEPMVAILRTLIESAALKELTMTLAFMRAALNIYDGIESED